MNIEPKPSVATSARTRRTALSVAIAVIATIPIATGSSAASDEPTTADTTESTVPTTGSPDETADSLEPNIGTSIVGDVRLTFTVPDGWENNGWFVAKANSDPIFGAILRPVGQHLLRSLPMGGGSTHRPVPPSMTSPQRSPTCPPSTPPSRPMSPSTGSTESKSSSPSPTTPTTNAETEGSPCSKNPGASLGQGPNYWAQGPHAHHRLWILDVDGTRLVIGGTYFPDTSQQDLDDLDTILNSIQIDPVFDAEQSGDDEPVETSTESSTSSA